MNVYFSPSTRIVVWHDGKDSVVTQLDKDYNVDRNLHKDPVDEETMLTLSVCRVVPDWERRDDIDHFGELAPDFMQEYDDTKQDDRDPNH